MFSRTTVEKVNPCLVVVIPISVFNSIFYCYHREGKKDVSADLDITTKGNKK
jgi:hypothetical protein